MLPPDGNYRACKHPEAKGLRISPAPEREVGSGRNDLPEPNHRAGSELSVRPPRLVRRHGRMEFVVAAGAGCGVRRAHGPGDLLNGAVWGNGLEAGVKQLLRQLDLVV